MRTNSRRASAIDADSLRTRRLLRVSPMTYETRCASHQARKSSWQKPESARTMILVSGHDSRILLTRKASVGVDPDVASMSAFLKVAARRCSPANTYKGRKHYSS